jgi:hypothetical protein
MENISTMCEQNAEVVNVKRAGTYSYHCFIKFGVTSIA